MEQYTPEEIEELKEYIKEIEEAAAGLSAAFKASAAGNLTNEEHGQACKKFGQKYVAANEKYSNILSKIYKDTKITWTEPDAENRKTLLEVVKEVIETQGTQEALEIVQNPVFRYAPNGELVNLIMKLAANDFDIEDNKRNRHEIIETVDFAGNRTITRTNKQSGTEFVIEVKGTELLGINTTAEGNTRKKGNKTFLKLFYFTLQELIAQNFPDILTIDLQKLVDLKMYKTIYVAKRAMDEFTKQQEQIKFSGKLKIIGSNDPLIQTETALFVAKAEVSKNYYYLYVSPAMNVEYIAQYYTIFPDFAYRLSINGFLFTRLLFARARQNTNAFNADEKCLRFNIKLDLVREALGLPTPEEVKNSKYNDRIYKPIYEAVEDFENGYKTDCAERSESPAISILFFEKETKNPHEWLDGYLQITLKDYAAGMFVKIAEEKENIKSIIRKERAKEIGRLEAKKTKTTPKCKK